MYTIQHILSNVKYDILNNFKAQAEGSQQMEM